MAATFYGSFFRAVLGLTLLTGSLLACQIAVAQQPQDPAAAAAGAALIASAEQDKDGHLYLPLPRPGAGETAGAFESRKLRAKNEVNRLLREELPLDAANKLVIERYFNNFEFRVLTQTTPEDLEQLPKRRFDLFKLYILTCKNSENHKQLIDLTLAMMQQIVTNNFHPIVRYNAMIIIGELNEQEAFRVGANPLLPEPYAAALNFMVDRIDDAKTPDPVRVAALIGILRHLEWEPFRAKDNPIPAGTRGTLITSLVRLAELKTPPAGRTAAGHEWLRRRAIEALGLASVTTALPNVVDTFEKILKDSGEPLHLRCAAALALGRANVPAGKSLDANELTRTLGTLAATSIKGEFDRLAKMNQLEEEHRAVLAGGVAGGPGGGGADGGFGGQRLGGEFGPGGPGGPGAAGDLLADPKAYRLEPVRKRLRYQLYCVQTGLGHPLDKAAPATPVRKGSQRIAASPAEKKAAEDVLNGVNKLVDIVEKHKSDLTDLETNLKAETKTLETLLARVAAPAAAPAAPAAPAQPGSPMPAPAAAKPPAGDDDLLGGAKK
jgi:hypothetical protein